MPIYIQILDAFASTMAGIFPSVPTFFRMMEVLACSMADFLPYILLVVFPFRNRTRLRSFLAGFLTLVMTPAVLYYDISRALLGTIPVVSPFLLMRSAALFIFAVLVIQARPGKALLNACTIANLSILISALTHRFAADYTAKHLLVTLLLQALLLTPYAFSMDRIVMPMLSASKSKIWELLFLIPAVGMLISCLMFNIGAAALPAVMIAILVLTAAGVAAAYYLTREEMGTLILKKEKPAKRKSSPAVSVSRPDPVQTYLPALQKRMLEAEFSYRELLLQVMTMEEDLDSENLAQLREKLAVMKKQLAPQIAPSGNAHLDPVLSYYTRQAMLSNIKVASNVSLPDMCSVSDDELTVLFGCLLDTALDSCREQMSGTRRIAIATMVDDDLLQIGVKHTYETPADQTGDLLNICRDIAARYDGKVNVIDMNDAYQIVVTLQI